MHCQRYFGKLKCMLMLNCK